MPLTGIHKDSELDSKLAVDTVIHAASAINIRGSMMNLQQESNASSVMITIGLIMITTNPTNPGRDQLVGYLS